MRKIATMKLDVLDYLLDHQVDYVSEIVDSLGDMAKTAQVMSIDEQHDLQDDHVAAILFHPHIGQLKKYACNDEGSTAINMHILDKNQNSLPDEIVKVAASNLTYVANHYGVDIPEGLKKYQSDNWSDNIVDLSTIDKIAYESKLTSFKTIEKQANKISYALESSNQFPLTDKLNTEVAVAYFEKHANSFTVEERAEFVKNTKPVISKYSLESGDTFNKYASVDSSSFNSNLSDHLEARINFIHDDTYKEVYAELQKSYLDLGTEKTAKLIHELDRRSGLDKAYGNKHGFEDAVLTTYGQVKVASLEIDGYDVTEDDLAGLDHDQLTDYMDNDTLSDLEGEEGLYMLKSLPKPVRDKTLEMIRS